MKDVNGSWTKSMTRDEIETNMKRYEDSSGKFSYKKVENDPETVMFFYASTITFIAVWIIGTVIAYIFSSEWNWAHIGICSLLSAIPFVVSVILLIGLIYEKIDTKKTYNTYKYMLSQVDKD